MSHPFSIGVYFERETEEGAEEVRILAEQNHIRLQSNVQRGNFFSDINAISLHTDDALTAYWYIQNVKVITF